MHCSCQKLPYVRHPVESDFDKVLTVFGADGEPIAFAPGATASFKLTTLDLTQIALFTATILPSPNIGQIRLQLPKESIVDRKRRYLWRGSIVNSGTTIRLASNQFYLEV
jgi:hypothetical protein